MDETGEVHLRIFQYNCPRLVICSCGQLSASFLINSCGQLSTSFLYFFIFLLWTIVHTFF